MGDFMKYLYMNDIEYLIRKRKKVLIALLLIPIIVMLINVNSKMSLLEIINNSMGTNLNLNDSNILELIMFLFNNAIYLFLVIDIYIKDIAYQLDNIFLRILPSRWLLRKNIIFISIILIIKVLQYFVFLFALFLLTNQNVSNIIIYKLIFSEFIYVIFIQYLFLFTYISTLVLKKIKVVPCFLFLVVIILLPKSIYELKNNQLCILFILLLLFLYLSYRLFKYHSKKIIEKV